MQERQETVSYLGNEYILLSDVPAKHKFVAQEVSAGSEIIMYGVLVGHALESLRRGDLLSTRNIRHAAASFHERENGGARWTPPNVSAWANKTFLGYHRDDGQVGSRNYWLVLPLVFCENRNLAVLKQAFEEELGFAAPQIYRSQVAELARLYREGKIGGVEARGVWRDAAGKCIATRVSKPRWDQVFVARGGLRRDA